MTTKRHNATKKRHKMSMVTLTTGIWKVEKHWYKSTTCPTCCSGLTWAGSSPPKTRSHYSEPVSLVEPHLSFHRDFFHFFPLLSLSYYYGIPEACYVTQAFLERWEGSGSRGNLTLSAPTHTQTHTHAILLSQTDSCEPGAFLGQQLVKVWFLKPEEIEASLVYFFFISIWIH